ncbi:hypothetical protein A9239_17480 [Methanosarcina sp. A14]|nr:hypothetical protein A9239_17480 [Methanosarcina sp. A14]
MFYTYHYQKKPVIGIKVTPTVYSVIFRKQLYSCYDMTEITRRNVRSPCKNPVVYKEYYCIFEFFLNSFLIAFLCFH